MYIKKIILFVFLSLNIRNINPVNLFEKNSVHLARTFKKDQAYD